MWNCALFKWKHIGCCSLNCFMVILGIVITLGLPLLAIECLAWTADFGRDLTMLGKYERETIFFVELASRLVNLLLLTFIVIGFNVGYCCNKRWGRMMLFYTWLVGIFVTIAMLVVQMNYEKNFLVVIQLQDLKLDRHSGGLKAAFWVFKGIQKLLEVYVFLVIGTWCNAVDQEEAEDDMQ